MLILLGIKFKLFSAHKAPDGVRHLFLHFIGGRLRHGLRGRLLNLLTHGLHGRVKSATTGGQQKKKKSRVQLKLLG